MCATDFVPAPPKYVFPGAVERSTRRDTKHRKRNRMETLLCRSFLKHDRQELHIAEYGNKDGFPAVFLHGGPGGFCTESCTRFFDLSRYRLFLCDQRGSGQSRPAFEYEEQTGEQLCSDIAALIDTRIGKPCLVFGGSWGSTLALAFAETYPEKVAGLILRGIFLNREEELDWLLGSKGAPRFRPLPYRRLLEALGFALRADAGLENYRWKEISERLLALCAEGLSLLKKEGGGRALRREDLDRLPARVREAAVAYAAYESSLVRLSDQGTDSSVQDAFGYALYESWHFLQRSFALPNRDLLAGADALLAIPFIRIVQGAFDLDCPPCSARELGARLPHAVLEEIQQGAHSPYEKAMADALKRACNDFLAFSRSA